MDTLIQIEPDRGTISIRKLVRHRASLPGARHELRRTNPACQVPGGKVPNAWFARNERKSLMFSAGLHVPQWTSLRKVKDGLTTDDLYGFLTPDPNALVKPIHEKAMPVLLLTQERRTSGCGRRGMRQSRSQALAGRRPDYFVSRAVRLLDRDKVRRSSRATDVVLAAIQRVRPEYQSA